MRRLTRRQKNKRKKQIIMISTICLLFVMVVGYAAFQTNLSITAKGNIKEKSRVIQAWKSTDQTDFHSDFYKQNIISATFLNNNNVPSNATESWNVSENKKNGGVMAWVIPNSSDNTKYDLYIGAKDGVIANENSGNLFNNFEQIININFGGNFDTSNTTTISQMFLQCTNLVNVDVNTLDVSNVTIMNSVFYNCTKIEKLDFSTWNTSNVIQMDAMFFNCASLTELNLSNFKTEKVTNMMSMFQNCVSLTELNLSGFDTSSVTNMKSMFQNMYKLTTLNISSFNTAKVTNFSYMFCGSTLLTTINLCSFDTNNGTNMNLMFAQIPNLSQIKVGTNWTIKNATTTDMFLNSGVSSVTTGQC